MTPSPLALEESSNPAPPYQTIVDGPPVGYAVGAAVGFEGRGVVGAFVGAIVGCAVGNGTPLKRYIPLAAIEVNSVIPDVSSATTPTFTAPEKLSDRGGVVAIGNIEPTAYK